MTDGEEIAGAAQTTGADVPSPVGDDATTPEPGAGLGGPDAPTADPDADPDTRAARSDVDPDAPAAGSDAASADPDVASGESDAATMDRSGDEATARSGQRGKGGKGAAKSGQGDKSDAPAAKGRSKQAPGRSSSQRRQRRGDHGRGGGRGGTGSRGRRQPTGGVSEETRRAITEGPPKRMLVNVGEQRTQIAVLEERDLVEHYVTRKEDVSYVGNIYKGRVQNVLPGMEAAFVDIGKGRNGVLYAGEVNYDESDLDDEVPRIEQTLKPGQSVLVQVTKDPMGSKGARLTQNLSIAGRFCVLAQGEGTLGISRKLTDAERDRLRSILGDVKPDGLGLIVRTAAEGATREQLEADVKRITAKWKQVEQRANKVKTLEPVYEEPGLVIRVIRDIFGPEYTELVLDDEQLGADVKDYLADVSPEHVDKVSVYSGETPLFDAYEVTTQIRRALEKKVWLKSGGYLIIEKTEAMWVIDVNTGRFVGKDNLEETVLRNNLEAADEIARQLRLRDMGGIIVIDYVDMVVPANRDEVLKRFKRELARDKTKSRVMEISKLGLVQMTRKNVSQGLTESFTVTCDCCEGRGAQIVDLG